MRTGPKLPATRSRPRPYRGPSLDEVRRLRARFLTPALMTYYGRPLMIVEGKMQYVWDETGKRYLDAFGGIVTVSVGHCHPDVTRKAIEQMETLQHMTTIYLHPAIAEYARALTETMPGRLKVCYFVNSGSEANDLALMMARLHTGNYDVVALRNGYHGGVASAMGLTAHSTWKHAFPQGFGVHHAICPDPYRGPWAGNDPEAGKRYAADLESVIRYATSGRIAGFFAESIQGVGGIVVYPGGYLREAYRIARAAGGVCIADEVQTGFGRTGERFWDFERQGVVPDIVTLAKSIGNGAPLAAVVTTPEIAASLAKRVHFNTFGGNPVSCAIGKAVLGVMQKENLQARCKAIGARLLEGLRTLQERHPLIGDVRGMGLMIGVELVADRRSKAPAADACARVLERTRGMGLLLGKGGFHRNVLRITPPMCVTEEDADFILEALGAALDGTPRRRRALRHAARPRAIGPAIPGVS